MNTKDLIDRALRYAGMTKAMLAKELEWSPQRLHQRIKSDKLTQEEWNRIAKAIGAEKAEMHIYFPDGKEI